jgi:pilus assembly protein CpaE
MILITISSDHDFHNDVAAALAGKLRFEASWNFDYAETGRVHGVTAENDCLAIIDFANPDRALAVARSVAGRPRLTAIAVGCHNGADELLRLMQAGIRDVIPQFSPREILQAATRATAVPGHSAEVLADLYAFVPAKPGCGATTVATYATAMAADMAGEPTLLLDFDLRLGVTTFLLKAEGTCSLADALNHVHRLDRDVWGGIVSQIGNLHLLGSGPVDLAQVFTAEQFVALLDFVVRQYSIVGVDLPGMMEDHECATLLRAKQIFLVCTPDVGALHLARRRAKWFEDLRVTDKVSVVLNCASRGNSLPLADVERVIGLPVHHLLPADVKEISKAVRHGSVLQNSSALGKQLAKIAGAMVPVQRSNRYPTALRRFVEYFSVSPARDAQVGRRS